MQYSGDEKKMKTARDITSGPTHCSLAASAMAVSTSPHRGPFLESASFSTNSWMHTSPDRLMAHGKIFYVLRTTIVALREMPPVYDRGPIFDESQN
ncbi:hypothetical protein E2C01_021116 [Portunus trituberculatus]|uniref:Uncharacterized protein n=1 Tax=Portunus trituberculatus TaxID=210409 RepID=A0A5B7E3K7_PORTR|nr:hypothetical protein [Portunus trituberculatus]